MTKTCEVTAVHWAGSTGGAVFTVQADEASHRVFAPASVMPRPPVRGEIWTIDGTIKNHPRYGLQVEATRALLSRPSGRMVLSFLKGPACPGIGSAKAAELWKELGESIYDALGDPTDRRIAYVVGDGPARHAQEAWADQEAEVAAWRWCDAHGLPIHLSRRLSAIYGTELCERMEENPYRILAFSNWKTAERLAQAIRMSRNDPKRLVGAVESILFDRLDQGHTAITRPELKKHLGQRLATPPETVELAIKCALDDGAIVDLNGLLAGTGTAIMERFVMSSLENRLHVGSSQLDFLTGADARTIEDLLADFEKREALALNSDQRRAAAMAAQPSLCILTGGAGTGKTTALKAINFLADAFGVPVIQAALAGRAARRMTEATGKIARTLMALEIALKDGLNAEHSLVIIDEASMLDLPTTYRLLRLLPDTARLLLVGDPAQLPPIGFGLILHALVEDERIPRVELSEVHRQAAATGIPAASNAIRDGRTPIFSPYIGDGGGVSFVECSEEDMHRNLIDLRNELPDAQIVTALRDGTSGTGPINALFHRYFTSGQLSLDGFCTGEPVLWTVNDYKLGLMNGSLGTILDMDEQSLLIMFDGERKTVLREDIDALTHAYAITVHKAQGSQFPKIIMPLTASRLCDRTLIYTGITRAQTQVVLMGSRPTLEQAIMRTPAYLKRRVAMGR